MGDMAGLPSPPEPIWVPLPPPPPPLPRRGRRGAAVAAIVILALVVASGGILVGFGRPAPSQGTFRFIERTATGAPVRWNPCEPIHYVVNLADAPEGALGDLRGAITRVSKATGIRFTYEGETDATVEFQTHAGYYTQTVEGGHWLPVLVIWLTHEEFTNWVTQEGVVAFAHPEPGSTDFDGQYVSGLVVVDAEAGLPIGFDQRYSDGLVLMHELGHLIGLAHVSDPNELMYTSQRVAGNPIDDWGPGDREGLRELGRDAGCLPAAESAFSPN
jgi:hypothetical protein